MKPKSRNELSLLLIDGPMGSGKTTVSKILHTKLKHTAHVSLDKVKRQVPDFKRIPRDISCNVLLAMAKEYLRQGISVLLDQRMQRDEIEAYKKIAKKYNAKCFIYQLDAPKELLEKRIEERARALGILKISKAPIRKKYKTYLNNKYSHTSVFDSEKLNPEQIAKQIFENYSEK